MRKFFLSRNPFLKDQLKNLWSSRNQKRCCSSAVSHTGGGSGDFDAMLNRRRNEAQRSIVVEVPDHTCAERVWQQCSGVGEVTAVMHYRTIDKTINRTKDMLLVEFAKKESMENMMRIGAAVCKDTIPARSAFFHFVDKDIPQTKKLNRSKKQRLSGTTDDSVSERLTADASNRCRGTEMPKLFREDKVSLQKHLELMSSSHSVSEQIQLHYEHHKASDLDSRLRFMACRQLEVALSGMFPHARATPFGSTVNGFGSSSSDLDIVLEMENRNPQETIKPLCPDLHYKGLRHSRLATQDDRVMAIGYLDILGDIMRHMMPCCGQIIKIPRARVPIIKYRHEMTGLECDLSMNNWSGIYMSEILYLYSLLDGRVGPLVSCLRLWAKENNLTCEHPGRWITNFSVTMLVLYYLISIRILPPLQLMYKHARAKDLRTAEEGQDCTFLRDLQKIRLLHSPPQEVQDLSLEQLLHGFFSHYEQFDFHKRSLSIVTGHPSAKPVSSPANDKLVTSHHSDSKPVRTAMHVQNPLNVELNVTRNVTVEELERFSSAVARARRTLEITNRKSPTYWGLLTLWPEKLRSGILTDEGSINWTNVFSDAEEVKALASNSTVSATNNLDNDELIAVGPMVTHADTTDSHTAHSYATSQSINKVTNDVSKSVRAATGPSNAPQGNKRVTNAPNSRNNRSHFSEGRYNENFRSGRRNNNEGRYNDNFRNGRRNNNEGSYNDSLQKSPVSKSLRRDRFISVGKSRKW